MWTGAAVWFAVMFALGTDRYVAHRSAEDLGIFYQSIASAFSGFHNTIEGASHFTVHFSPILYLLAPLVWLFHSALPLVFVETALNACVAPALFLIARKRVPENAALFVASLAFLYPPLCGVAFADFHENSLAVPVVVWLLYALDARKFGLAALLGAAALAIKEDQALFLAVAGTAAYGYFSREGDETGKRWSIAAVLISLATFAAYFTVVRPLAGAGGGWHPAVFYTQTQADVDTSWVRAFTDRAGYLVLAFAPLAFLPLRSRVLLLAAAPFAEILLSRAPVTYTMGQHYAAVWIPYVLVAYVLAACALHHRKPPVARGAVLAGYAVSLLILAIANPLHPKYFLRVPRPQDAQLDAFIATLPTNLEVGTQEEAYTHMGFYPRATLGMEQYPDYALFDWNDPDSNWVVRDGPKIRAEVRKGRYRIVREDRGIVLYRRTGPKPAQARTTSPAW